MDRYSERYNSRDRDSSKKTENELHGEVIHSTATLDTA